MIPRNTSKSGWILAGAYILNAQSQFYLKIARRQKVDNYEGCIMIVISCNKFIIIVFKYRMRL